MNARRTWVSSAALAFFAFASLATPASAQSRRVKPATPAAAKAQPAATQRYARTKAARETVKLNRVLRSKLRAIAESTSRASVYHQIKDASHRAKWVQALGNAKTITAKRAVMNEWIGAGNYPGLWTLTEKSGWYGQDVGGKPIEIKLRKDSVLYDADNPEHVKIYETWKQGREKLHQGKIPNAFEKLVDSKGTPLSNKTGAVHAPKHEKFYRDLNISGVAYHDTYGRKCVILFNAKAMADIKVAQ